MTVQIFSPEEAGKVAVGSLASFAEGGSRYGYMFGSERNGMSSTVGVPQWNQMMRCFKDNFSCVCVFYPLQGLTNEDLSWATAILQIPTNTAFSSLNLGQAVQIIGYECK